MSFANEEKYFEIDNNKAKIKFSVNSSDISKSLSKIQPVVERKNSIAILSNIKI